MTYLSTLIASKKTLALILGLLIITFFFLIYRLFFLPVVNTRIQPTPTPEALPKAAYAPGALDKDLQRIQNRKTLSLEDIAVKDKLLSQIGNKSGTLLNTADFQIDYVAAVQQYMVEIHADDAEKAKNEAQQWFTKQGLSSQGICNLPVVYFLDSFVLREYRAASKQFNPIPDGC